MDKNDDKLLSDFVRHVLPLRCVRALPHELETQIEDEIKLDRRVFSPPERLFIEEYLVDFNAQAAANRAHFDGRPFLFLQLPHVQAEIEKGLQAKFQRVRLNSDLVIAELMRIAFLDVALAFNEDGTLHNPKEMPEDVRRSLVSFELVEEFVGSGQDKMQVGWTKKVKFSDKIKALDMLGRHLKLFADGTINFNLTWDQVVAESRKEKIVK